MGRIVQAPLPRRGQSDFDQRRSPPDVELLVMVRRAIRIVPNSGSVSEHRCVGTIRTLTVETARRRLWRKRSPKPPDASTRRSVGDGYPTEESAAGNQRKPCAILDLGSCKGVVGQLRKNPKSGHPFGRSTLRVLRATGVRREAIHSLRRTEYWVKNRGRP